MSEDVEQAAPPRAGFGGNLSLGLLLLRVIWRAKAAGPTGKGGPLLALVASSGALSGQGPASGTAGLAHWAGRAVGGRSIRWPSPRSSKAANSSVKP